MHEVIRPQLTATTQRARQIRRDGIQQCAFSSNASGYRFEETSVLFESGPIVLRNCLLHVFPDGRRDDLHTADENACDLGRSGLDIQWQNGIDGASRDDVEQPRTFFKPGITPRFDHGPGLPLVEALLDKNAFEIHEQACPMALERFRVQRDFILNGACKPVSEFSSAILKQDKAFKCIRAEVLHQDFAVAGRLCRYGQWKSPDAAIEKKLFLLRSYLQGSRIRLPRGVVVAGPAFSRKIRRRIG